MFIVPLPLGITKEIRFINVNSDQSDSSGSSIISFGNPALKKKAPVRKIAQVESLATPDFSKNIVGTDLFPVDEKIRRRVGFWINVYTQYTTSEGVIHDSKHVDVVYKRIDFSDLDDFSIPGILREKEINRRIKKEKELVQKVLQSIHKKTSKNLPLTSEEQRYFDLFSHISEDKRFLDASSSKRIRFQLGQKDRFLQGLFYSGRYLSIMEKIFKEKGVPTELTRLPFVESSFNLRAQSKVGASGIWQFMRSTGKLFLKIDESIDERNDPIRATEAAALLLKGNYSTLGHWALAITAYNHGRLGMSRAVNQVRSQNIGDIIDNYKSPSFGFASSNFYAEFLAALEISTHIEKYFGRVEIDQPVEFSEFVITDHVDFRDIATYCRIPYDQLQELNPGLSNDVFESKRLVPAGYVLRIPPDKRETFYSRYREIPTYKKFSSLSKAVLDYYARIDERKR